MTNLNVNTSQIKEFAFTKENEAKVKEILSHFPAERKKSGVLPLLDLAQRQIGGWLPMAAIEHVSKIIEVAPIRVLEVASFYSMFNLNPVGQYLVQVCTTTPCWLCGSDKVLQSIKKNLGIEVGGTTKDGKFTVVEVECLGACVNAPIVQINDDFYEDTDENSASELMDKLKSGQEIKVGSQKNRQCSSPLTSGGNS